MALDLATLKLRVASLVQDRAGLLTTSEGGDVELAIRDALEHYSSDVPRIVVADVAGDGATYDLALPSGYVPHFSTILSIESPTGNNPATLLEDVDWSYYQTGAGSFIRLNLRTPETGETTRIRFTGLHTLDDFDSAAATTIWLGHSEAFVKLVAAKCLERLAARFLHEQESTLSLDTVDRGSRTDQARRLATAFLAAYREVVGASGGAVPMSGFMDWDVTFSGSGYALLTHGRRVR